MDAHSEQELEALYGQAEALLGVSADALRGMALMAHKHRADKQALSVFRLVWGRNPKHMVRAVQRHPDYFTGEAPVLGADGYLALFSLGRMSKKDEAGVYDTWRDKSLRGWQVRDLVQSLLEDRKGERKERIVLKGAVVREVDTDAMGNQVLLIAVENTGAWQPGNWRNVAVTVSLSREYGGAG